ncbi:hypothetical protein K469DRAFT_709519 [Zopfia rhizophila CBS 207.26]|uniref:Uncharacterized protein n=1 Tax=Zopfia rhizophila CBS 207.26 TaxID=1314779 RepID=A0A6A6ETB7_9PEZI|nr:hypothetical protein K469DRAFT_709519 [Zopfia rhizophila CBS 207.26]
MLADYIASLFSTPAMFMQINGLYMVDYKASALRFGVIIGGETFFVNEADLVNQTGLNMCILAIQRQRGGYVVLGIAF